LFPEADYALWPHVRILQGTVQPPSPYYETPQARWLAERRNFLEDWAAGYELLKQANGTGEHLLAIEIAEAMLSEGNGTDRTPILQQMGRALAVLGSSDEARSVLQSIEAGRADAGETFGLLGRVWKDLAASANTPEERLKSLNEAYDCYQAGFQTALERGDKGGGAYCGINAAAVSIWLDEAPRAAEFALKTMEQADDGGDYYSLATRAEANLILGRDDEAKGLYQQSARIAAANRRWADLASTRKQCRELSLKLHGRRDHLDSCFPTGAVAIFSGEALTDENFSAGQWPQLELDVRKRVTDWLSAEAIIIAFGGGQPGWDLVLLEIAQDAGIETHLVLPCDAETFIDLYLKPHGEAWVSRFIRVSDRAVSTILNDDSSEEASGAVEFTRRMIAARGALLAGHLGCSLKALAVGDRLAETAIGFWLGANLAALAIHPSCPDLDGPPAKDAPPAPMPFGRTIAAPSAILKTRVCALVHFHFAGYRGLRNEGFDFFQTAVLGTIAGRLAVSANPPVARQGFGADYLFVFDRMQPAAVCALELLEALKAAGQTESNRIDPPSVCLHAGPVRMMVNPVLHQYAHEGALITTSGVIARRLPSGVACATETFTALAALESLQGLRFEHAGKIEAHGRSVRLFQLHYT